MIENEFRSVKGVDGFLLDGFPRTLPQAEALDNILNKNAEEVTATVSIMIPDEMVMERIKGRALKEGRADDASEDIINNRIATYHAQTEPLIEYYTKAGKYHEADGVGSIDDIRERIFNIMDKF
jgi:adenylate kinase